MCGFPQFLTSSMLSDGDATVTMALFAVRRHRNQGQTCVILGIFALIDAMVGGACRPPAWPPVSCGVLAAVAVAPVVSAALDLLNALTHRM